MKIASRFHPRPKSGSDIHLVLDGTPITAQAGDTVAAAILAYSSDPSRTTSKGMSRAPYCMMGICFECLIEIDGKPNTQGCMTAVRDGMVVRRQNGLRPLRGARDA
jgi:predicted molibdopterin-dependent oxidoreductase YjgC